MCNVSVVKHGPVCLGPAVQLCGMAGGDYFKLTGLHTLVAQLPLVRRNVLSCEAVYFGHIALKYIVLCRLHLVRQVPLRASPAYGCVFKVPDVL